MLSVADFRPDIIPPRARRRRWRSERREADGRGARWENTSSDSTITTIFKAARSLTVREHRIGRVSACRVLQKYRDVTTLSSAQSGKSVTRETGGEMSAVEARNTDSRAALVARNSFRAHLCRSISDITPVPKLAHLLSPTARQSHGMLKWRALQFPAKG